MEDAAVRAVSCALEVEESGGGGRDGNGVFDGRSDVVAVSVVGTEKEVAGLLVAASSVLRGLLDWPMQVWVPLLAWLALPGLSESPC